MSTLEKKRINHPRWDESKLPEVAYFLGKDFCRYIYQSGSEIRERIYSPQGFYWPALKREPNEKA